MSKQAENNTEMQKSAESKLVLEVREAPQACQKTIFEQAVDQQNLRLLGTSSQIFGHEQQAQLLVPSEIQNKVKGFCNAIKYQKKDLSEEIVQKQNYQKYVNQNTPVIQEAQNDEPAILEKQQASSERLQRSNVGVIGGQRAECTPMNENIVPQLISLSNTQSVMHTKNNSTYETKNNENSIKERRVRKNQQEIIEQSLRQRPSNQLLTIIENYQRARQQQTTAKTLISDKNIQKSQVVIEGALNSDPTTAVGASFQREDDPLTNQQQPSHFQNLQNSAKNLDNNTKLLVYKSSDDEEEDQFDEILNDQADLRLESKQKRPNLYQFLQEFEEGMRTFNQSYFVSKQQFLKDMKSFNMEELRKEDEIIERSIKDSNYYPETNQPQLFGLKDKQAATDVSNILEPDHQIKNQIPDIEASHEASNYKQTVEILDLDKSNDLKIRLCESFIPPRQVPAGPLNIQSQPLSVGQVTSAQATQQVSLQPNNGPALAQTTLNLTGGVLTLKQQRSQTIQNYIQHICELYEGFQIQPNSLQPFYPSQVQKHLNKRKNQNTDRIVHGLANPTAAAPSSPSRNTHSSPLSMKKQTSMPFEPSPKGVQSRKRSNKHLKKMKQLSKCQANFMQVLFQKIDRRSKPIKKHDKELSDNLNRKNIFLEQDGWDILNLLKKDNNQQQNQLIEESRGVRNQQPYNQNQQCNDEYLQKSQTGVDMMHDAKFVKKILKSEKDRQATLKQLSFEKQKRMKIAAAKQQQQQNSKVSGNQQGLQNGSLQQITLKTQAQITKLTDSHASKLQVFKITSEKEMAIVQSEQQAIDLKLSKKIRSSQDSRAKSSGLVSGFINFKEKTQLIEDAIQNNEKSAAKMNSQVQQNQSNGGFGQDRPELQQISSSKNNLKKFKEKRSENQKSGSRAKTKNEGHSSNDEVIHLGKKSSSKLQESKGSSGVKNKCRKLNHQDSISLLAPSDHNQIGDNQHQKGGIQMKRYKKNQKKESQKLKNIEKNGLYKQHTMPAAPQSDQFNDKLFDKNLNISMQATEGATQLQAPPHLHHGHPYYAHHPHYIPGLELHTHHHQHQHHHTYYYHFHNLEQNYQVFQQHFHPRMYPCGCSPSATAGAAQNGSSGGAQTSKMSSNPINQQHQAQNQQKNSQAMPSYAWAPTLNQYGPHSLALHPSYASSPPIVGYVQQPLLDQNADNANLNTPHRVSQNSVERDDHIIPSKEYKSIKKYRNEKSLDMQASMNGLLRSRQPESSNLLGLPSSLERPHGHQQNDDVNNPFVFLKQINSPGGRHRSRGQLLSPLNQRNKGYLHSFTRHEDGQRSPGGVISHVASPTATRPLKTSQDINCHGQNVQILSKSQRNEVDDEILAVEGVETMTRMVNEQAYWDPLCDPLCPRPIPIGYQGPHPMLFGEPGTIPVSPLFMMPHLPISRPPEITTFNMPKNQPLFEQKKKIQVELKSATLADPKEFSMSDSNKINKNQLIKSQNHSMDRKAEENLEYQSDQRQPVSCSSSGADDDDDEEFSSGDSGDESGSRSSSSSSSSDSDSSCDPMHDSNTFENYQASLSFKNNDCLNIIDSYESQQEQLQKDNEQGKYFKSESKSGPLDILNQPQKHQQIQNSQQYNNSFSKLQEASEPLGSSNVPLGQITDSQNNQGQALINSTENLIGATNIPIEELNQTINLQTQNQLSKRSQGALSTPSFQMQLNKDLFEQQDLDIKKE